MALRQIDVYIPAKSTALSFLSEEPHVVGCWEGALSDDMKVVHVLMEVEVTEAVVDKIEQKCGSEDSYRLIVHNVEATLPRLPVVDEQPETSARSEEENETGTRISREELYQDVSDTVQFTSVYVVMVALSTIVAAGGLLSNSIPVIIGAMVIAPLFGPNVALSLATTLGDATLARRALMVNLTGLLTALGISVVIGLLVPFDVTLTSIASQTDVVMADILLALTAGAAGALSFTQGVSAALIGVMVAVALLPPLVAAGLLLGTGAFDLSLHAGILVLTNLISVNLAGVATFLAQGIQPGHWWEARKARKQTWYALGVWIFMLVLLFVLIWYM